MAVDADPGNTHLRTHLAELLLDSGEPAAALENARKVLAATPADVAALFIGERAARESGETELADGYRSLLDALSPEAKPAAPDPQPTQPEQNERLPVAGSGLDDGESLTSEAEIDQFLESVLEEDARSRVRLSDVFGLQHVKERLELSFLGPVKNASIAAQFGKSESVTSMWNDGRVEYDGERVRLPGADLTQSDVRESLLWSGAQASDGRRSLSWVLAQDH